MENLIMPIKLEETMIKFNALTLRLRIMITISVIAILFMLFDVFWFADNDQIIGKIEQQIMAVIKQSDELVEMQQQHNQNIVQKRNDPKNLKLISLNKQLSKIREQLTNKTINLVQPADMANVLKMIIGSTNTLELQILSKQETVELSSQLEFGQEKQQQESAESNQVRLFRHSMEIVLKGDYSSTYQFLNKLEEMDKKVAFDSFEYVVSQYPKAEITLVVSTLSLQKGWIGG